MKALPASSSRQAWQNIGGQLIPAPAVRTLIRNIRSGKIEDWDGVHAFYLQQGKNYSKEKTNHAFACLLEILSISHSKFTKKLFNSLLEEAFVTRQWMSKLIYESRAKDYESPFRQMVYETQKEMENVIGKLEDNSFIRQQKNETLRFGNLITDIRERYSL
jgi:hypothetical protein